MKAVKAVNKLIVTILRIIIAITTPAGCESAVHTTR